MNNMHLRVQTQIIGKGAGEAHRFERGFREDDGWLKAMAGKTMAGKTQLSERPSDRPQIQELLAALAQNCCVIVSLYELLALIANLHPMALCLHCIGWRSRPFLRPLLALLHCRPQRVLRNC